MAFAFALLQGVDIVATRFNWPGAIERYLILALVVGFFVVLVLAWYHGEKGAQRIGGMEIMILALLLAIGGGLIWRFGAVAKTPHVVQVAKAAAPASPVIAKASNTAIPAPAASTPEKSVAVLPFANMSGDPKQQFFSDGLTEDLINTLSQYQGLKVISRDSAFQFRDSKDSSAEIGKLLGVAHLLEGSVQRAGDEVRITATLVDAANGSIVWSQRYDQPYTDLFKLQDAITAAVAAALRTQLVTAPGAVLQTDRPPSGSLAAYTAYQQGNADTAPGTEAGMRKAIIAYEKAIRFDPDYAAAYVQLSSAWLNLPPYWSDPQRSTEAYAKARVAIETALKLDPDSAAAHAEHSNLLSSVDMDWAGAEAEARRALQLAPNSAGAKLTLGQALATLGQVRQAVKLTREALVADPRHAGWYNGLSIYLTSLGQLDEADKAVNKSIELQAGAVDIHEQLAAIAVLRGQPKAAQAAAQAEPTGPWHAVAMTLALQIGPDHKAADAALQSLIAKDAGAAAYQIAEVYALRKDPDAMFHWLDRAWANRDPGISNLLYDPFILRYRHDPRFAAFCKKIGLPTTTDAVAMK